MEAVGCGLGEILRSVAKKLIQLQGPELVRLCDFGNQAPNQSGPNLNTR